MKKKISVKVRTFLFLRRSKLAIATWKITNHKSVTAKPLHVHSWQTGSRWLCDPPGLKPRQLQKSYQDATQWYGKEVLVFIIIIIDNFCIALFSCVQTHCALQHSPTFSKFHKHYTFNYDNHSLKWYLFESKWVAKCCYGSKKMKVILCATFLKTWKQMDLRSHIVAKETGDMIVTKYRQSNLVCESYLTS